MIRELKTRLSLFIVFFLMISASIFAQYPGDPPSSLPEPGTLAMLGAGLVSVGLYAWKKRKRS